MPGKQSHESGSRLRGLFTLRWKLEMCKLSNLLHHAGDIYIYIWEMRNDPFCFGWKKKKNKVKVEKLDKIVDFA